MVIDPATLAARHPWPVLFVLLAVLLPAVDAAARWVQRSAPTRRRARVERLAGTIALVAVVVFAASAAELSGSTGSVAFDEALASALSRTPSPALSSMLAAFTHLGDRATLIAGTVLVGVLLAGVRQRALSVAWCLTCIGNGMLNPALKAVFARARPVHDAAYATVGEYSFPSGHTSGSVVVYGMLAYVATRVLPARWHVPTVLVATTCVVVVGFSRIWLRVHWASDVVAGLAAGSVWLALCIVVTERLRRRAALNPR